MLIPQFIHLKHEDMNDCIDENTHCSDSDPFLFSTFQRPAMTHQSKISRSSVLLLGFCFLSMSVKTRFKNFSAALGTSSCERVLHICPVFLFKIQKAMSPVRTRTLDQVCMHFFKNIFKDWTLQKQQTQNALIETLQNMSTAILMKILTLIKDFCRNTNLLLLFEPVMIHVLIILLAGWSIVWCVASENTEMAQKRE